MVDSAFDADRAEVLERASKSGVCAVVAVGETLADAERNLGLAEAFPILKPAAGLYPTHLDTAEAERMIAWVRHRHSRLVAIGEVGLDRWVVKEEDAREIQIDIFRKFIRLAGELGLPLNVHSRSAGREAVRLLLEEGAQKVQLHAFDGKAGSALPGVEAGFFFSIPPSVVRSRQKQKLVSRLPLCSLLVETDSPVLGASPEERNEPANARVVVEAVSEIKGLSREEVAETLLENTCRLFGKSILETSP
jgi:TatD DNase family protein